MSARKQLSKNVFCVNFNDIKTTRAVLVRAANAYSATSLVKIEFGPHIKLFQVTFAGTDDNEHRDQIYDINT